MLVLHCHVTVLQLHRPRECSADMRHTAWTTSWRPSAIASHFERRLIPDMNEYTEGQVCASCSNECHDDLVNRVLVSNKP